MHFASHKPLRQMSSSHCTSIGMVIQVEAPVPGAMFLADAALGFVARNVSRMNAFVVGIPFKIAAGMVLLIATALLYSGRLLLQCSRRDQRRLTIMRGM